MDQAYFINMLVAGEAMTVSLGVYRATCIAPVAVATFAPGVILKMRWKHSMITLAYAQLSMTQNINHV